MSTEIIVCRKEKHTDDKLSTHFMRSEFDCSCDFCNHTLVAPQLLDLLEIIREHFNRPVIITSGFRCQMHNRQVPGAATNSYHTWGLAADIKIPGTSPKEIKQFLDSSGMFISGIGLYSSWLHIDVAETPKERRW